jgi:hypothetical protein
MPLQSFAWLPVVLALSAPAFGAIRIDPKLGHKVYSCKVKGAKKHVWIVKVIGVDPRTDTHAHPESVLSTKVHYGQAYRMLEEWATKGGLKTFFSQGCFGEIKDDYKLAPNGWKIADLRARATDRTYSDIVALTGLKLKAKLGPAIAMYCADEGIALAQEYRSYIDVTSLAGILERYARAKDDPINLEKWRVTLTQYMHVPATITPEELVDRLKAELKKDFGRLVERLAARDDLLDRVVADGVADQAVAIVEDLHAKPLAQFLEEKGIGCDVVEPEDYQGRPEAFVAGLRKILGN